MGASVPLADALDVVQFVHAGKGAVGLAIFDDALGQHLADAGQCVKLMDSGGVYVEQVASILDGGSLHRGDGRERFPRA